MAKREKRRSPAKKVPRSASSKKKAARKVATDGLPVYSDGQLQFRVEGGTSDGKKVTIDLVSASVVSGELELKHRLDDQGMRPSGPFLVDIAKAFGDLGDFTCTPSVAYQIWHEVGRRMAELQKKTS